MKDKIQDIVNKVLKSKKFKSSLACKEIQGLAGLLKPLFITQLSRKHNSICVISPQAEELADDIQIWSDGKVHLIPSWDEVTSPPPEIISDILAGLNSLLKSSPGIIVTKPIKNLPSVNEFKKNTLIIKIGETVFLDKLVNKLSKLKFKRVPTVRDLGEFAVRGSIIDCWSYGSNNPVRIEFLANKIISIREFDSLSQISISKISSITEILPAISTNQGNTTIKDYLNKNTLLILDTVKEKTSHPYIYLGEGYDIEASPSYQGNIQIFNQTIKKLKDYHIFILCESEAEKTRVDESLPAHRFAMAGGCSPPAHNYVREASIYPQLETIILNLNLSAGGFILPDAKLAVFTYSDIFGHKIKIRVRHPFKGKGIPLEDLQTLHSGDFVVHVDYGIGMYKGLKRIQLDHTETDCLLIQYKDNDKLYIPIDKFRYIERWIGHYERPPKLTALGSGTWERKKKRAKKAIQDLTHELLSLYAERKILKGYKFSPDTVWQAELESSFPYEETPDQLKVIEEIKSNMESENPMDRLVCGEVGYGKTEVALRAAFKAVLDNKQVAILCPTTILAEQHLRTFEQRLKDFPIKVEMLSRFRTKSQINKIILGLKQGKVDIVIGTHKLLSNDIHFKDIGLLVIDEEHRFGVRQKEKLKHLKKNIDTLSLTATPIPRTLYISLTKIRNFSQLETPPQGRLSIITQISPWDEHLIRQAILYEIQRGGQVYFVHNRIQSINIIADIIRRLNPSFKIGIAHSELSGRELELIMLKLLKGEINVLVTTAIIGSGIDIPQVNTIIINRADRFGLSDLHQLRGRVGRADKRAYCYLLVPKNLTPEARKRLQAISTYTELGSGFKLALRDLELRGAGNLLGREQHGHIQAIGYELYTKLLEDEIKILSSRGGETVSEKREPILKLGGSGKPLSCYIPDSYIDSDAVPHLCISAGQGRQRQLKLGLYKRLSEIKSLHEVKEFKNELTDRFGPLPRETKTLLLIVQVKILASRIGITKITKENDNFLLEFSKLPQKNQLVAVPHINYMRDSLRKISNIRTTKDGVALNVHIKTLEKLKNFLAKIK
ncbi:transcription-repair coupling factor [candidate division WOR-3 bacterium]|nr:transcription-repair coupling factor [candidate division WOR-3 bacterium]